MVIIIVTVWVMMLQSFHLLGEIHSVKLTRTHTHKKNEKLWPKGVRVQRFCILRVYRKSIKWTWAEPFEMNAKGLELCHR